MATDFRANPYDPSKLLQATPNYGAGPTGATAGTVNLSGAQTPGSPARQGFVDIDPLTGKPKMLGTAMGTGSLNLGSLLGMGKNVTAPGQLPGMPPFAGGAPGGTPGAPGTGPIGSPTGPGALPTGLLDQTAGNLGGALRGELPQDVINMLQTEAAERGVGGGVGGSQFAEYGGLRTLGLTSLDRMKHAEDLLANQFANPKDQLGFEQSRLDRESADKRAKEELDARNKIAADDLAFRRQQEANRAAEQANALAQDKLEFDLQALGGKYGGVGGSGTGSGLPVRNNFYGGENGPGPLNRLF